MLERIVANQFVSYLNAHSLAEPFQSGYKKYHSTETTLLYVTNDILRNLDKKQSVILVLLDLSTSFDTVDHRLGVNGQALSWFKFHFTDRAQCVSILGSKSAKVPLTRGVPQGSILGPIAFTAYTLPLGDIARKYHLGFHVYTDDTQIYLPFDHNDPTSAPLAIDSIDLCISEIREG